jgi:hypothetical protein
LSGFAASANGLYTCDVGTVNGHYSYSLKIQGDQWPWRLSQLSNGRWAIRCEEFLTVSKGTKSLAKADVNELFQETPPSGNWVVVVDVSSSGVVKKRQRVGIAR